MFRFYFYFFFKLDFLKRARGWVRLSISTYAERSASTSYTDYLFIQRHERNRVTRSEWDQRRIFEKIENRRELENNVLRSDFILSAVYSDEKLPGLDSRNVQVLFH